MANKQGYVDLNKDGESPDELLEQENNEKALIKKKNEGPTKLKKQNLDDILSKVSKLNNDIYKGMINE